MGTCFSKHHEKDPSDNEPDKNGSSSSSSTSVSSVQMKKKKKKLFSFNGKRRNVKHDAAYFTYKVF